jgi:hypothetical protein
MMCSCVRLKCCVRIENGVFASSIMVNFSGVKLEGHTIVYLCIFFNEALFQSSGEGTMYCAGDDGD